MDFWGIVEKLGTAFWELKVMCDQHKVNTSEAKELHDFIQDLQECNSALAKQFQGRTNLLANIMLKNLATDINEAIDKLNKWLANPSSFLIFNAHDRKQELEKMHEKVMSSIHKNGNIAILSIILDVHASQATIIEQGTEMKSLLTSNIKSMQRAWLPKVRAEVVEASWSPYADYELSQEVLAAIDSRNEASGSREQENLYEDPIIAPTPSHEHYYSVNPHKSPVVDLFVPQCCVVKCQVEINRCLFGIRGVDHVAVDYNNQKVTINAITKQGKILRKISDFRNGSRLYDYEQDGKTYPSWMSYH